MTESTADPATKTPGYVVRDFIDAAQLKRDLAFSPTNLSDAMMQQASLFAHYGQLSADASRQENVVELLLENTEAAVYKLLRDEMAAAGEKITESLLEKLVARHPRVVQMKKALNEARRVASLGKTAVEAFRHRRDMLVQQGLISREEMKGEVYTYAKAARDQAQEDIRRQYLERRASGNEQS